MSAAGPPRVAICDYGIGNVRSVERALQRGGAEVVVSADATTLLAAEGLVLPGVGAFAPAAAALRQLGLAGVVRAAVSMGKPLLGVCLGFQLLFSDSDEGAGSVGLDIIPGRVRRLRASGSARVPHVGWNTTTLRGEAALFAGVADGTHLYYTHAYAAEPADGSCVIATTTHGAEVVAAVAAGPVLGTQFHPEKSGIAGLRMYVNFVNVCAAAAGRQTMPA